MKAEAFEGLSNHLTVPVGETRKLNFFPL